MAYDWNEWNNKWHKPEIKRLILYDCTCIKYLGKANS